MSLTSKKTRPMHFTIPFSGETLCGKNSSRCRATSNLSGWDDGMLADGRRCPVCTPGVEKYRAEQAAKVTP